MSLVILISPQKIFLSNKIHQCFNWRALYISCHSIEKAFIHLTIVVSTFQQTKTPQHFYTEELIVCFENSVLCTVSQKKTTRLEAVS